MTKNAADNEAFREANRWATVIKSWESGPKSGLDFFQLKELQEYNRYMAEQEAKVINKKDKGE